ncbi:hypothetical protein PRUPE_1G477300 [Prunus persica]|uniref:Uncharacterized protein n=1 Tax=Prunus persica TaxID=3760 RepID=M5Y1Z5_PRUPE|nr:hypothetical protein PRUPE_1G477300 [Prunus persica]
MKKVEESSNEASFDIENQATSMENRLTNLRALSPACWIYRVPERLRNVKQKAYTPQVVSIDPLHHASKNLEAMEDHKLRYLKCFLNRTKVVGLKDYLEKIKEREVDAAFVIELLLRNKSEEKFQEEKLQDDNAWIFKKPWVPQNILPDMLMLENQLPFFILEDLYNLTAAQTGEPSIIELSYRFFRLEKTWRTHQPSVNPTLKENVGLQSTPSMTKLHQAGVKFNVGSSKNLFDIQFKKNTLEIPKIEIHDYTELTHRNLIAFEQCHCVDKYISDYVFILDKFVNTPKDVELLVDNGIVVNTLGDNNQYCKKTTNRWKANLRQKYFNTPWAAISLFAAIILLILTLNIFHI